MSEESPIADSDGALKEALHDYLEPAFRLCFARDHALIDWSRGVQFMENELQKVIVGSETGRRSVDLLAKVWGHDGLEQCLLLHIEIQAQRDPSLPERILEYYFKLRDIFRLPVASFAILADDDQNWKPEQLVIQTLSTRLAFDYSAVKLTGMDVPALEASDNPFAVIIVAHLAALRTKDDPETRRGEKFRIFKLLYERWGRDEIRRIMRLIDWLMQLPKDLELRLQKEIIDFEKEKQVTYVPTYERKAREEGVAEGEAKALHDSIALALRIKFPKAGEELMRRVMTIDNAAVLRRVLESVMLANSVDEVRLVWEN